MRLRFKRFICRILGHNYVTGFDDLYCLRCNHSRKRTPWGMPPIPRTVDEMHRLMQEARANSPEPDTIALNKPRDSNGGFVKREGGE